MDSSIDNLTSRDFFKDSNAHFRFHATALKDSVCNLAYKNAFYHSRYLFEGKTVLDVGCGTGILSMLAARAGAAKIIAVDQSDIVKYTRKVITANNLDSKITVVQQKVQDLTELPDGITKVDIIVSQWMGYCVLHESVLDAVLSARNKWLKKENGVIFPDRATLYIIGIEAMAAKEAHIEWWNKVYGFDMSCIRKAAITETAISVIRPAQVATSPFMIKVFDLYTMRRSEIDFSAPFFLFCRKNEFIHGFATYFNVEFSKCPEPIYFSTSPDSVKTHFQQTVFYIDECITAMDREEIIGKFKVIGTKSNFKKLHFTIDYTFAGKLSSMKVKNHYTMK